MRLSKMSMMLAATLLAATPALAQPANPAASLSIGKSVRAGSARGDKSALAGGGFIIAIIAVAAVIAGIVVVADNNDKPDSP